MHSLSDGTLPKYFVQVGQELFEFEPFHDHFVVILEPVGDLATYKSQIYVPTAKIILYLDKTASFYSKARGRFVDCTTWCGAAVEAAEEYGISVAKVQDLEVALSVCAAIAVHERYRTLANLSEERK